MRLTTGSRPGDERGNVIIAVLVILIVTISVVATTSTVTNGLRSSRVDQDRSNAFQYANAGIDQALYRIDSRTLPTVATGTYSPTVTAGVVTGFTDSLAVGTATYQIVAVQDPVGQDTTWKVRSTGTEPNGRQRQAIATVQASRLFENAFFTLERFELSGNQFRSSPVAYYSGAPGCQNPTLNAACEVLPAPGRLGTNGVFTGSGIQYMAEQWSGFAMYGRSTQAAADEACGNGACGTAPEVEAITEQLDVTAQLEAIEAMRPANPLTCPNGGNITGGSIAPGDYACSNLNLSGTITVSGTGKARFWITGALNAARGTVVNAGQRPQRLQLYQVGPVPDDPGTTGGDICRSTIWALIYAPRLLISCGGSNQPEIFGAVVANLEDGAGNHFAFHWDITSRDAVNDGRYNVVDWRECPVSVTDC